MQAAIKIFPYHNSAETSVEYLKKHLLCTQMYKYI